jgi:cytochrome c biogenesis protein CcmG, thiol:disulfide interchange protein DsbE
MPKAKIDRFLRTAILVLAAALVYVIYASIHQTVVEAGDTAPKFTITADNGRSVSVPNFGGKLLVLNFWASWCQPCAEETPSLSQFAQTFADKGVVVLALSVDKSDKAYRKFLQDFKPAFLTARNAALHENYGTYMWPETYIIDSSGKVVKKIVEPVDWNNPQLVQYINSLL